MKRFFIVFAMLIACVSMTMAQEKQASIRFEKINYNFGKFSEKEPVQKCVFTFVNQGTQKIEKELKKLLANYRKNLKVDE